jgi:anaerobic ribonucleoside-triphosphate reductase activating protein
VDKNKDVLRIHRFLSRSYSNGPGARAVIWTQGCSLKCPGCFNPETHTFDGGELISPDDLFKKIDSIKESIEGITVSGGEPLEQANSLADFLHLIKKHTNLSIIILTGFEWTEIQDALNGKLPDEIVFANLRLNLDGIKRIIELSDVIIAGRYKHNLHISRQLRGSSNKTIHCLTNRYSETDFDNLPDAEIIIGSDGNLTITGINPPKIKP